MDQWEEIRRQHYENLGRNVAKACGEKGFNAQFAPTGAEALEELLRLIPEGSKVGVPGSVTIREMGALEGLERRGCTIVQHWDPSLATPEEKTARLQEELQCPYYLTSANAVTQDGMLVSIDGVGNRVAGMAWAPGVIIYVIGINKISRDLPAAFQRIRDWATPMNGIRLGMDIPCAATGYCMDCNSPGRACRATLVLERAPMNRTAHVIIVGEPLGF
ncbi:MAG: lactate utilization protein [Synergistales bacterium]|nr:lactate utilization protein [Synergistales bacterium]